MECARIWARYATWTGPGRMTTRPTRARVCEAVRITRRRAGGPQRAGSCTACKRGDHDHDHPLSEGAYKAVRRWMTAHGYLGTVEEGSTPRFRPAILADLDSANTAATYVLCIPQKPRPADTKINSISPLSCSRRELDQSLRASNARSEIKSSKARPPGGQSLLPRPGTSWLRTCPQTRSDGLAAAEALQACVRELRSLSPGWVRHLARPYWQARWTAGDVLHALDYPPDGRQHRYSTDVHHVVGWMAWRLARWLGPDGTPLPSPSQVRAAARERDRQDQARRRAEAAARAERLSADPATHADRIRAELGWRRGSRSVTARPAAVPS
jgi:hypothetical protein